MENEDDIDKLFKQGLKDPEIPFNELDWERMEQKLDAKKPKKLLPVWILTASSIAAVLLIFLFWLFMMPEKTGVKESKDEYVVEPSKTNKKNNSSAADSLQMTNGLTFSGQKQAERKIDVLTNLHKRNTKRDRKERVFKQLPNNLSNVKEQTAGVPVYNNAIVPNHADSVAAVLSKNPPVNKNLPAGETSASQKAEYARVENRVKRKMESSFNKKQGLTLSLMAAPDVTTAASSKSSKLSSNLGVLVTYAISNKLSLTSGAVYSKKYYNSAGFAPQTNSYAGQAWEVDADCNVLDIPVNVNYKLFTKRNIAVSVNTGLSSYLMLKEKYTYLTGEPGANQQISTLEVRNQNQHIFGVANVSISVDRKITPRISIAVQPFMKIPLTGIGNGNVDLKSTGLSFSLNIGLFPAKKQEKNAFNR